MSLYLIAYDLDKPGQDYDDLYSDLNRIGAERIQDSVWVVKGTYDCVELRKRLQAHMDSNDRILVVGIDGYSSVNGMTKIKDL